MANLGYIGLGAMGGRIVDRLIGKGHTLTGHNRTRSKAQWLIDKGMTWGDTPRAVAASSDVVLSMVTDSTALKGIAEGPDGVLAGLGPGKVWIEMSTVSPAVSRAIAEQARAKGAEMLDVPVSGSISTLEAGKLTMMVGGRKEAFERVQPILMDIGMKATHVGDNGLAVSMKIAVNISVAVQMIAFSEGVLLAEKSGIARKTAVEVLTNSAVASPVVQYRGPFVLNLPEEAWFSTKMMQKDVTLALETGRELGVPLPTASIANEVLTATRSVGLADKDYAALFQMLAKISGVQV
jgi:3-hydroxyisobutyrate dehydrogenase-like beta-hydroxyacid dehydrogenase